MTTCDGLLLQSGWLHEACCKVVLALPYTVIQGIPLFLFCVDPLSPRYHVLIFPGFMLCVSGIHHPLAS